MDDFNKLKYNISKCNSCKDDFGYEPHPIFWGNKNAKIMQISQAPSLSVHNTLKPFNDLSGKKLRQWYGIDDDIFYNQDNFYITSLAHCYPGKSKSGGDRLPPKCCSDRWLKQEIEIVENKIYIVVGSYAAKKLFPKKNFKDLIFNDQFLYGKRAFVLPHPSPLNMRWFKNNPNFEQERILEIREVIHSLLFE
ncbi:uracil-DNA glycosylase, family 4 [Thomasclavelia cocleata]|uniref:Uracil-DNA glycosylase, family 4 n=2 Tax=Thomasclavelia cocleata TaxID=69824 RepID=A0A1I0GI64_9FIRM|nr:uracil-DNA glycosylase family protein [Thomasclavelia cocleata]MCR1961964.1 uracil-DNA glycosylase family protein [Thomasclavelia cocleata]NDO43224.1 uracil-DNA glycosylase [Thomasclavelia cocleata]SET70843.1 uracil-DNA glycosylase, family 4 [Thomasclavelia cocleata]